MITQAIALAMLTFISFFLLFRKFPPKVKAWFIKHPLLTDAITTILTYGLLGMTLTALFASAVLDIFILITFYIVEHKEEFQYLWDFANWLKVSLKTVQEKLKEFGTNYKNKNPEVINASN